MSEIPGLVDQLARAIYMTHWKPADPDSGRAGPPVRAFSSEFNHLRLASRVLERLPFIGYPERRKPVPVVLETSPIPQAAPEMPARVHQGGEPTPDREPAPAAVGRLELALRQSLVNTEQPRWQPSGDDIRACLAALRGIEEFTDYRLVKLKEGEHQRWVFQARID